MRQAILTTIASIGLLASEAPAQSNIDGSVPNKHAWGENIGWTNWRDATKRSSAPGPHHGLGLPIRQ